MAAIRSALIWAALVALIVIWLPLLALIRLFDRDPVVYRTGRWFRRLGVAMTKVNPQWRVRLNGEMPANPRNPYVVVSNHQSHADIPILSWLPWEMKWVGKAELWKIPVIGWEMRLSKDIPVDRKDARSGAKAMLTAKGVLERKCSVIFFPEGTRSPDGRVHRFTDGAFHLALKAGVPILPVAVEGSRDCLPKKSWVFGPPADVTVRVLPPYSVEGKTVKDVAAVRDAVRGMILREVAAMRGVDVSLVDGTAEQR